MAQEPPFKIARAAQLADLKVGMVDYLCRQGIVLPSSSKYRVRGKERLYTFNDVVMLRTLKSLLKKGVSVSRLKDAIKTLRKRYPDITQDRLPYRFFITDGKWILLKNENDIIENINNGGQFLFSFVVDIEPIRQDVITRMALPPPKKTKKSKAA